MAMALDVSAQTIAKVHATNARHHDECAELHDQHVPYIARRSTRMYYWRLITGALTGGDPGKLKGARVLEIGCGTGTFTDLFLDADVASFTGIDLSPRMIEMARAKAGRLPRGARVSYHLRPLEDFAKEQAGNFDFIVSASFLHHLANLDEGLTLIRSMLAPRGSYVAVHEMVNGRKPHIVEVIDNRLQYMFGYNGYSLEAPWKRVLKALPFSRRIAGRLGIPVKDFHDHDQGHGDEADGDGVDYVDYQLNDAFSLSRKCGAWGEVRQYCYFGFVELMKFARPDNHEMLIVREAAPSRT
jgi:2-polyprenyl-3-methyl-5-hydroxy-6-metoxy-1,4-benzoquinol methylase